MSESHTTWLLSYKVCSEGYLPAPAIGQRGMEWNWSGAKIAATLWLWVDKGPLGKGYVAMAGWGEGPDNICLSSQLRTSDCSKTHASWITHCIFSYAQPWHECQPQRHPDLKRERERERERKREREGKSHCTGGATCTGESITNAHKWTTIDIY